MSEPMGGREALAAGFTRAIRDGRLGHAYLFRGPEGVGKREFALRLVAALECQRGDGTPCLTCDPCRAATLERHPDLFVVGPEGARRVLPIERIRRLVEEMSSRPWGGRGRTAILDPADRLTEEAANCLLAILEAPPPGSLFLLVTARPEGVLPTIRSRAMDVFFGPLSPGEIEKRLGESGLSAERAREVAGLAEGSWHAARRLADPGHWAAHEAFLDGLLSPRAGDVETAATLVATLSGAEGEDSGVRARVDEVLSELLALARNALRALIQTPRPLPPLSPADRRHIAHLAALGVRGLARLVRRTVELRDGLERSAALPLALEAYAYDLREMAGRAGLAAGGA
ncbi:MAG: DNA polymerase III subunit [Planctomycetes bacterium]|nr:DNA polymerase III subunit [Planctomycetota bacterium]